MFRTIVKEVLQYLLNKELERITNVYNSNPNIHTKQKMYDESVKLKELSDKIDTCKK
jgi:hypothetical protein